MSNLVPLPQAPRSARVLIEASGLSDDQVADQLNARLVGPVIGPVLVRLWRQELAGPPAAVIALLAQLTPAALPALARVS